MATGAYNYTPMYGGASYDRGFIGPVKPGSTIGGVDPLASRPSGQILGATNTAPAPAPAPAPTGDNNGGGEPSGPSIQDILNQQYEAAFNQLGQQESALGGQRTNQEQIATNTYNQGAKTLGSQYTQNTGDIEQGQGKALTDLSDALRQQWQQGNVMLGTRGASDSSAAKQYSYALTKLGTQQQGDIMQENARRLDSLKQTYETNLSGLETEKNNNLLQIANWYSQAQQQIGGLRAELQGQKSQQLLDMAMQSLQQVQQQTDQQRSVLDQWAANTAKSLPQLQQQLQQNAQNLPAFQGLFNNVQFSGSGGPSMIGFGQEDDQQANMFGVK